MAHSPSTSSLWVKSPLGRFFNFHSGDALKSANIHEVGDYPVYGGNGVRGYSDSWNLDGFNLLVGRQGALAGNVHRMCGRIFATEHALIAKPLRPIDRNFAYWLLVHADLNQYAQDAAAQPGLSATKIRKVDITLPIQFEEQSVIAAYLDSKTAEIDSVVEKLRRQRELLERYKRELIAHTVTRGLNPDAPTKPSDIDWIGDIPFHWACVSAKSLLTRRSRKGEPTWRVLSVERERGVVDREFEGSADNHNRLPDDLRNYLVVESGQFVMNKMKAWQGSYGISSYNGIVSPAYYVFDLSGIDSEYFNWLVRSKAYIPFFGRDSYGIRTDQWDFKVQGLRNISILLPPIDEQVAISNYLAKKVPEVDGLVSGIDRQVELLQKYRKQLINDVVTGRVRVCEEGE